MITTTSLLWFSLVTLAALIIHFLATFITTKLLSRRQCRSAIRPGKRRWWWQGNVSTFLCHENSEGRFSRESFVLLYFIDVLPLHRDTFTVPIVLARSKLSPEFIIVSSGLAPPAMYSFASHRLEYTLVSEVFADLMANPILLVVAELSSRALKIWTKGCSGGRRLNLVCVLWYVYGSKGLRALLLLSSSSSVGDLAKTLRSRHSQSMNRLWANKESLHLRWDGDGFDGYFDGREVLWRLLLLIVPGVNQDFAIRPGYTYIVFRPEVWYGSSLGWK